jgi:YYY domain-containing protein
MKTATRTTDGETAATSAQRTDQPSRWATVALLAVILLLGGYFRTLGLTTWDEPSFRLHPDERFFTDVASLVRVPESWGDYFDSSANTLNPRNRGKSFYVYGLLPQTLTRLTAVMLTPNDALPQSVPRSPTDSQPIPNPELRLPKLTPLQAIFNPGGANLTDFYQIHKVGRSWSTCWDLCSIVVVFLIGRRLYGRRAGLLAALLLALSVLPIQLSHFFTVDAASAFFTLLTVYLAVRIAQGGGLANFLGAGLSIGAAMACRVTLATLGLTVAAAVLVRVIEARRRDKALRRQVGPWFFSSDLAFRLMSMLILAGVLSALTFRVLQPDAFMGSRSAEAQDPEGGPPGALDRLMAGRGFFDIRPEPRFISNISEIGKAVSGESDSPPAAQWSGRTPFVFALQNMLLWGMGLPLGLAAWIGWLVAGWQLFRRRALVHLVPWFWVAFYFAWQGGQFVMTMRYYGLLYGLLALFAAWLLLGRPAAGDEGPTTNDQRPTTDGQGFGSWPAALGSRFPALGSWFSAFGARLSALGARLSTLNPRFSLLNFLLVLVVVASGLWAYAFTRIYTEPHSRIAASRWIFANIPPGAKITSEEWDDPLPLNVDGKSAGQYIGIQMRPYYEDDQIKYTGFVGQDGKQNPGLLDNLDEADYLIFSSNRVYDSATRMAMRYPVLSRYYNALFTGQLGFRLVADIHSYPRLFGVEIPTPLLAEEAFSVYDHPRVLIFQKTPEYSRARAEQLITEDVAWNEIYKLPTLRTNKVPTALRLTDTQWPLFRYAGTWTQVFDSAALVRLLPWLFWLLALELIGLAAFALLFRLLPGLPDGGFALSKTLGLLAVAYLPWLLASVGARGGRPLLEFSAASVWLCTGLLLLAGGFVGWRSRAALATFARARRAALLTAEGLFLVAFFAFLLVRALNPDLWHYARGGEKPMDLTFLTAVVKSPAFPPYDPWFAGGYINYYYFGFVLIGALIQLTGLEPTTAYNLAVPTVFALTALGAWGVAYNLLARSRFGALERWRRTTFRRQSYTAPLWHRSIAANQPSILAVELPSDPAVQPYSSTSWEPLADEPAEADTLAFEARTAADTAEEPARAPALHTEAEHSETPEPPAIDAALASAAPPEAPALPAAPLEAADQEPPRSEQTVREVLSAFARRERRAIISGVLAAIFVVLLGNLSNALWMLPGTAEADNPTFAPECRAVRSYAAQQECRGRTEWAFWDATRIVGTALKDSTITEFPFFTFIYGDLHAHMLSLPLALAALGLMVALVRGRRPRARGQRPGSVWAQAEPMFFALCALALVVGALRATNTWDYPTYLGLGLLTLALAAWDSTRHGLRVRESLGLAGLGALVLAGLSTLLFLPFTSSFATDYAGFRIWDGTHTPTSELLQIYGLWLALLLGAVLLLYRRVHRTRPVYLAVAALVPLALAAAAQTLKLPGLVLLVPLCGAALGLLVDLLNRDPRRPETPQISLSSILPALWGFAALGLALLVEVVVTKGDIGRMNTVFKFGMQSWVLFALTAAVATVWVWERSRSWAPPLAWAWRAATALLILAGLVYPLTATPAHLKDRFDPAIGLTLDGAAYMRSEKSTWAENNHTFGLAEDAAALEWMRQHIVGTPVVLEAQTEGYRWGGRVSIYTGLPTLLGWPWHETQQRSVAQVDPVLQSRKAVIQQLYNDPLTPDTIKTLRIYGVEYVYVGQLERALYSESGLAKFDAMVQQGQLVQVYSAGATRIYRLTPSDTAPGIVTATLPVRAPTPPQQKTLLLSQPVETLPAVDEFAWNSLAASQPVAVLLWLLFGYLLLALGLPPALLVFGRWRDGGVGWARLIGLLLLGYAIWLPTSARLLQYDRMGLLIGVALVLLLDLGALALLGRRARARWARAEAGLTTGDQRPATNDQRPAARIYENQRTEDEAAFADQRLASDSLPDISAVNLAEEDQRPTANDQRLASDSLPDISAVNLAEDQQTEIVTVNLTESAPGAADDRAAIAQATSEQPDAPSSFVLGPSSSEADAPSSFVPRPPSVRPSSALAAGLQELREVLTNRRRALLQVELLYLAAFALFLVIRLLNPDLWQPIWGGEKPFEFGFLNAILRSPVMPPYSPFYSDGVINYYYYGLYLVSLPIKAVGVAPAVGFNLVIPMLFGLTAACAFTLVRQISGRARFGLVGVAFLALLGNMAGYFQIGWSQGFGPVGTALQGGLSGFGQRLGDWFIGPSRVIPNTINEFPFWSFLFADLHPHLIALPITILAIGLAYTFLRAENRERETGDREQRAPLGAQLSMLLLAALVLGTLAVTNSWDFPTYTLVIGGGLLGAAWRAQQRGRGLAVGTRAAALAIGGALLRLVAVSAGALILFLPFFQNFQAQVGGVGTVQEGSVLQDYVAIYALFLAVLLPVLLGLLWRSVRALRPAPLIVPRGAEALGITAAPLQPPRPDLLLGGVLLVVLLLLGAASLVLKAMALKLWLLALLLAATLLLMRRRLPPGLWFAVWLAWVGWAVSLGIELIYVKDHLAGGDWYRMNTVFKFGYQIWTLLALAAAILLPSMLRGLRRAGVVAQIFGGALLAALALVALIFPLAGTPSRVAYRFEQSPGPTLDGLAFMDQATYKWPDTDPNHVINLAPDAQAIRWITQNIKGTPILLQSSMEFYRAYGVRIAANTGLPTVVSPLHESEQRNPNLVGQRDSDVIALYSSQDLQETLRLLSKYRVGYVYVGPVERLAYGENNVAKFERLNGSYLNQVYNSEGVQIFKVNDAVYSIASLPPANGAAVQQPDLSNLPAAPATPAQSGQPAQQDPPGQPTLAELEAQNQADPSAAGPAFGLAQRYRSLGRLDDAAKVLGKAAETNANDIAMHHLLGDILRDAGRPDEAEAAYTKAAEAAPTVGNYNKLGFELIGMGRPERAEPALLKAIQIDPSEPEPYFNLGQVYERLGKREQAIQNYQEYLGRAKPDAPRRDDATKALARLQ